MFGLDFSTLTAEEVLHAAPKLEAQIAAACCHAVFWYIWINFISPILVRPIISNLKSKDQLLAQNKHVFKKVFLIDLGDGPVADVMLFEFTVLFMGIIMQHGVGGALCVPAITGGLGLAPKVVTAMACQGGLCEVGWEIQDTLQRIKMMLFDGEMGKKFNPPGFLLIMVFHHTAAQCLVIPNNIYYRDNRHYAEGIFLLQGAAFCAFYLQQYGFTLNIKERAGLFQMKLVVTLTMLIMVWSRLVRYGWLWYLLLSQYHADGSVVFKFALPPVVFMSLFNVLLLLDAAGKFAKFIPMTLEDPDLHHHAMMALDAPHPRTNTDVWPMSTAHKEWSKLKGAVKLGAFHKAKGN